MGLLHRKYPHAGADKSGAIEAYHFSIKFRFFGEKKYMRGRRLDWLVHKLVDQVLLSYMHRKQRKDVGLVTNKKSINKTHRKPIANAAQSLIIGNHDFLPTFRTNENLTQDS